MRTLPALPNTQVTKLTQWSNFHHTIAQRAVPLYLTPGARGVPAGVRRSAAFTPDLNAILAYCMTDPPERLCTLGARWSLSNILDPASVVLDPGIWNEVALVAPAWLTDEYLQESAARQGVPVIAQSGITIRALNQVLGTAQLALQVSGANDGHRLAGCIATGTHGSHLRAGAVHDSVLGMYLVTGPNQAVFLQPSRRRFTPRLAAWFQAATTLATRDLADDELFAASQVALGGLGFVHSVIIEAVPLYEWYGRSLAAPLYDATLWHALETLDATALGATTPPEYFSFVFSPFASAAENGSFATWLCKRPATRPYTAPGPVRPRIATDLSQLLSHLIPRLDHGVGADVIGAVIAAETSSQYDNGGPVPPTFPDSMFGPTPLPEGNGRSVELVVNHGITRLALQTVLATLQAEGRAGRHLLGGVGVRFAPQTSALLGMNIHPMNTYIEFPSLGSADTSAIHRAVWRDLRAAGVPFTCHWGQEYGMDASSVRAYFGDRVERFRAAREVLLPSTAARAVFTNPLLETLILP